MFCFCFRLKTLCTLPASQQQAASDKLAKEGRALAAKEQNISIQELVKTKTELKKKEVNLEFVGWQEAQLQNKSYGFKRQLFANLLAITT